MAMFHPAGVMGLDEHQIFGCHCVGKYLCMSRAEKATFYDHEIFIFGNIPLLEILFE